MTKIISFATTNVNNVRLHVAFPRVLVDFQHQSLVNFTGSVNIYGRQLSSIVQGVIRAERSKTSKVTLQPCTVIDLSQRELKSMRNRRNGLYILRVNELLYEAMT